MVTLLRPHRHAHGPAAVTVRLSRRSSHHQQQSSSSSLSLLRRPCRSSALRPMAQDPSHPHLQSKEPAAPPSPQQQQQPEQPELAQQQPAPEGPEQPPPPPRDVQQEPSTSSSAGSDTGSWLQLGIGPSPSSPSPSSSRRKRQRTDEAGPSTSVRPAAPSPPQLQLSLQPGPSSSSTPAATVGAPVVAAAPPPPRHEPGTWFLLQAAQNQRRDPPLPQIPRRYLRVRDGRMTVRVVMRYLVNKLGLDDDSQGKLRAKKGKGNGAGIQPSLLHPLNFQPLILPRIPIPHSHPLVPLSKVQEKAGGTSKCINYVTGLISCVINCIITGH